MYKRFDLNKGRKLPNTVCIPCQEADKITGHHPHWVLCDRNDSSNKYHFEAFDKQIRSLNPNATYELCGEKVQGNPEKINGHILIEHGSEILEIGNFSFDSVKSFLRCYDDIEGIVFHDIVSDKMCKIRKSDFGIKR